LGPELSIIGHAVAVTSAVVVVKVVDETYLVDDRERVFVFVAVPVIVTKAVVVARMVAVVVVWVTEKLVNV
jgi:hypothetical protein